MRVGEGRVLVRMAFFAGLALALVGGFGANAFAASNLIEVYELALANDSQLKAAEFKLRADKRAFPQAIFSYLPRAVFQSDLMRTRQDVITSDNTVFATGQSTFDTTTIGFTLTQPIFNYETISRIIQAREIDRQATAEFAAAGQDLILRTAQAYFVVLAAADSVAFAEAELEAIKEQLELAREQQRAGLTTFTTVSDIEARHEFALSQAIDAKNELADAREALREIVGERVAEIAPLGETLPLVKPDPDDVEAWVEAALENNLSLRRQRHAIAVAKREVSVQRASSYPTIDLVGTFNRQETDGSLFGGGSTTEDANVMLRFRVPLFNPDGVGYPSRAARYRYRQAIFDLRTQERQVERETRAVYNRTVGSIAKVTALEKSVAFQKVALEESIVRFKANIGTSLDVLDAQRDLYRAKRNLARARYDYLLGILRLKQLNGSLGEPDLEQVNALLETP